MNSGDLAHDNMETGRATSERCPVCGGETDLRSRTRAVTVGARTVRVPDEYYRCRNCREQYYHPEMAKALSRRATAKIREEDGLLPPEQIRAIRRKHRLTQPDFERLLGVGTNTVVRWEAGTVPQGSAADSLLRVLDSVPGVAAYLSDLHGVDLARKSRARDHAA